MGRNGDAMKPGTYILKVYGPKDIETFFLEPPMILSSLGDGCKCEIKIDTGQSIMTHHFVLKKEETSHDIR